MKLIPLITLCLVLLLSCQQSDRNQSVSEDDASKGNLTKLQEIVGYLLSCETKKGPAFVYVFAPHILGLWSDPQAKTLEYFISQFVTGSNELLFESVMIGQPNMHTAFKKLGELKNRRIMMKFKDGRIRLLVAFGLNEKDRTPINPHEIECTRSKTIAQSFETKK